MKKTVSHSHPHGVHHVGVKDVRERGEGHPKEEGTTNAMNIINKHGPTTMGTDRQYKSGLVIPL